MSAIGMRRSAGTVIGLIAALTLTVGGCSSSASPSASPSHTQSTSPKVLKAAMLLDAAAKDGGWDQVAENGFLQAAASFGSKVHTTTEQSVPFSSTAAQIVERLIGQGYTLFFADSSGYEHYLAPIAAAHPNIRIEEVQGAVTSSNYGMYETNIPESTYIAGMMLAGASKNGFIGMVAGFPFPAYYNIINGVEMGAKAVNPKATERVIYVSSFFDPTKEASAANALISDGATAIVGSTNDPSVCQTAAAKGVPCMNEDLLQSYGPKTYLGSFFMNTGWAVKRVISDVLSGQSPPRFLFGDANIGAVSWSFGSAYKNLVSPKVQAMISSTIAQMKAGKFHVFQGPLKDSAGHMRVPAGKYLNENQFVGQTWYVQGVST